MFRLVPDRQEAEARVDDEMFRFVQVCIRPTLRLRPGGGDLFSFVQVARVVRVRELMERWREGGNPREGVLLRFAQVMRARIRELREW